MEPQPQRLEFWIGDFGLLFNDSGSKMRLKDAANLFNSGCNLPYLRSRAGLLPVSALFEGLVRRHG